MAPEEIKSILAANLALVADIKPDDRPAALANNLDMAFLGITLDTEELKAHEGGLLPSDEIEQLVLKKVALIPKK